MAMHLKFRFLLLMVLGTMAASRARDIVENADGAGDDIRPRVFDFCRAMLSGERLGKEPLVLWEERVSELSAEMTGNWSFQGTGDAAGEGSLATNTSGRQVAGGAREGGAEHEGAAVRRHLLFEAASPPSSSFEGAPMESSRAQGEGPASLHPTWGLRMQQEAWRSPNVGWVSGSLSLQGLLPAQLAGLGLPASKEEGARNRGSGLADIMIKLVGLIVPEGEAPGGNLCLLGCLPSPLPGPRMGESLRRRLRSHFEQGEAGLHPLFLDSGNCTVGLQLHYTAPKLSRRGYEDESLWGSLRPLPLSEDKPYFRLSSDPPAHKEGSQDAFYHSKYIPTVARQASEVCSKSGFLNSTPSSLLANFVGPLFGGTYPTADDLGFMAKHPQDAGGKYAAPLDWLRGTGVGGGRGHQYLAAGVRCTSSETFAMLRNRKAMAEVNMNLAPQAIYQEKQCFKEGWLNNTAPADRVSDQSTLYFWQSSTSPKPQTVALQLVLLHPVLVKVNSTPASSEVVGEGTYYPRTGKLCLLACLIPAKATHRSTRMHGSVAAAGLSAYSMAPMGVQEEIARVAAPEVHEEGGPPDCQISITIQYPKFQPWPLTAMRAPLTGRVESLRQPQEAEYFAPHEFISPSYMSMREIDSAVQGAEARQACIVLVISVAVVLVLLQTRHLKKHPTVGSHVSLYFVAMQVAGLALLILSGPLQAMGDTWRAFLSSENVTEPTLWAVLLLAYVRLFMRVRGARARCGRGLTREEDGAGLELLLSKAREQRELEDLEGGEGPSQAPGGGSVMEPSSVLPPAPAADEVAAGGRATLAAAAASEMPAFLLCIPLYMMLLLCGLMIAAFNDNRAWDRDWDRDWDTEGFLSWQSLQYTCGYRGGSLEIGGSFCLIGVVLRPIGICIRDLVLLPQLAFAALCGTPNLEAPPLARSYAYGTLLCQFAVHGLIPNPRNLPNSTIDLAGGPFCILLQLILYYVMDTRRQIPREARGKGEKESAVHQQDQETT